MRLMLSRAVLGILLATLVGRFAPVIAQAAQKAPDFTLSTRVVSKAAGNILEVTAVPPAGNHINIKAPMALDCAQPARKTFKPSKVTESEVKFEIPCPKERTFSVTLYLCDDRKSYCEDHKVTGTWDPSSTPATAPATASAPEPAAMKQDKPAIIPQETDSHGFILNNPEKALQIAKKSRKPLLIDFQAIWCPACNQLEETVFSTPEFAKAAARFVKLKIDVDSKISWPFKVRYKVSGYPTVVFTASDGEEVRRVVGTRSTPDFVKAVGEAWTRRNEPLSRLVKKADSGNEEAAGRAGEILLERGEFLAAARYLSRHREQNASFRQKWNLAAIGGFEEARKEKDTPDARKRLEAAYEAAIAEFPLSADAVDWRVKLAELQRDQQQPEKSKQSLRAAIAGAMDLIDHPARLAGLEVTPPDLWETIADAYEQLEQATDARTAWQKAAAEFRKRPHADTERGTAIELAYCLWKSGEVEEAKQLYGHFELKFPNEFTFFYGHGSMLFQLKNFPEAEPVAARALEYSYGDNRLRAATLLAKIDEAQGKKSEALKLVRETLSQAATPEDKSLRTHRYIGNLKDIEVRLTAQTAQTAQTTRTK